MFLGIRRVWDFIDQENSCKKSLYSKGWERSWRINIAFWVVNILHYHLCRVARVLLSSFSPFPGNIVCFSPFFFNFRIEGWGLCSLIFAHSLAFLPAPFPERQIPSNKPLCEGLSVTASLRNMTKISIPIIWANKQTKPLKAGLRLNSWSYFM